MLLYLVWPLSVPRMDRAGGSSKYLSANLADKFLILPASGEFYPRLVVGKDLSLNFFTRQSDGRVLDFTHQRRFVLAFGGWQTSFAIPTYGHCHILRFYYF